jgi:hypothetical protein
MKRLSQASAQPRRSSDELTIAIQVETSEDLEARVGLTSGNTYEVDLTPMRLR